MIVYPLSLLSSSHYSWKFYGRLWMQYITNKNISAFRIFFFDHQKKGYYQDIVLVYKIKSIY